MAWLKITWVRSAIGSDRRQRRVVRSLGLRRLHQSVVQPDTPYVRGMVFKVQHLLQVEEASEEEARRLGKQHAAPPAAEAAAPPPATPRPRTRRAAAPGRE